MAPVNQMPTLNEMNKEQFNAMMQKGYDEAQAGIGLSVDEAFKKIHEDT